MLLDDIIFLLGSYLIVIDGEINDKEHRLLLNLFSPSDEVREQQGLIYSDSEEKIPLEILIERYKEKAGDDHSHLFEILFQLEHADGYAAPEEEKLISRIANQLEFPKCSLDKFREQYNHVEEEVLPDVNLSWSDSLSAAFKALIAELKGGDDNDSYSELLSGTSFAKKIKDIAKISQQDLSIAEDIMTRYNDELLAESEEINKNILELKKQQRKEKEVEKLIEDIIATNDWIRKEAHKAVSDNLIVLDKKKRTINYFTIAFMGRTKAGKSTFHKVITHEENDDIGRGKLRTTRFNRSFYWENIRIVDTPGIGAPGGKSDTETASSIIDEADLICYIVTDDSIQTTEFDFLIPLKERSKPLFIILNIKGGLDHPKRLEKFIKNPLRWKNDKGRDDIQGHYKRINDVLGDKYDMSMVEIIPLQLYAAILMNQPDRFSEEEKAQLLLGSNIQEYVQKVKKSIYRTGSLKKTQNIYDGCTFQINQVINKLEHNYSEIDRQALLVDKARAEIVNYIEKESKKAEERLDKAVINAFQKLRNNANRFTEKYYDVKEDLTAKWQNYPDNKLIYSHLSNLINKIGTEFNEAVRDRINECLSDIKIQDELFGIEEGSEIKGKRIINYRLGVNLVGNLVTATTPLIMAALFSNPGGWAIFIGTVIVGLFTWGISKLFKSKEQQITEAKEKMLTSLLSSIDESEYRIREEIINGFSAKSISLKEQLDNSFKLVSVQSRIIIGNIRKLINHSEVIEKQMTSMFAYRILRYLRICPEYDLNKEFLNGITSLISAKRSYHDSSMNIQKPTGIPKEMLGLASKVTQIKINN